MRSNRLFLPSVVSNPKRTLRNTIATCLAIFNSLPSEIQTMALAAVSLSALPVVGSQDRMEVIKNVFFQDQQQISNYYASFYDNEVNTQYSIDLDAIIRDFTSQCNMTVVRPSNLTDFAYIAGYMNSYDIVMNGVDFYRKAGDEVLDFFEDCFKQSAQLVFSNEAGQGGYGLYALIALLLVIAAACAATLFQMRDGIGCCQAIMYYNDPIIRAHRERRQHAQIVEVRDEQAREEQKEQIAHDGGYHVIVDTEEEDEHKEALPERRGSPLQRFSIVNTALQQPLLSREEEDDLTALNALNLRGAHK